MASPRPVPKTSPEPSQYEAALRPPSALPPWSCSLCPQMHCKFDSATCPKSCNSFSKSFPYHLLGFGLSPWHLPQNGVGGKGHPCATAAAGYKSPSRGGCAHTPFLKLPNYIFLRLPPPLPTSDFSSVIFHCAPRSLGMCRRSAGPGGRRGSDLPARSGMTQWHGNAGSQGRMQHQQETCPGL